MAHEAGSLHRTEKYIQIGEHQSGHAIWSYDQLGIFIFAVVLPKKSDWLVVNEHASHMATITQPHKKRKFLVYIDINTKTSQVPYPNFSFQNDCSKEASSAWIT